MRRLAATLAVVLAVAGTPVARAAGGKPSQAAQPTGPKVLVLYDTAGPYGYLGGEYGLMVRNLLGHFDANATAKPVSSYSAGDMAANSATFYLGTTYEEGGWYAAGSAQRQAYEAFLADAAAGQSTLVWLGFNIWNLAWQWDPAWGAEGFAGRFGFSFQTLDESSWFNRVNYKATDLYKGAVLHENPGAVLDGCREEAGGIQDCAPGLGVVSVTDAAKATVFAEARSTFTGAKAPYVTKGGKLWYVGDIPFSFLSEEDRYLAFTDLLHDMLGIPHTERHRALVRLEDVSAMTSAAALRAVNDVLKRRGVQFGVATIPQYLDPLGATRRPVGIAGTATGKLLDDFEQAGNDIVQHGTTHQFGSIENPFNGMTGDDFEFYRVTKNEDWSLNFDGPVPGDSAAWAIDRMTTGKRELDKAKLRAIAWEPPHYTASAVDYAAIKTMYPVHWGRAVYFSPGAPDGRFVGQFFPYETTDVYGQRIIPENLGNIEPYPFHGYALTFPADLIRKAKAALVVRDGFASFFFHPDYPTSMLDQTVAGIQALGYQFVRPCTVSGNC